MTSKIFFNRYLPLFLSVIGLLAAAFIVFLSRSEPQTAEAGWYNSGGTWGYRKEITIDRTKLSTTATTTFSNFPFLFSVTDSDLETVTNGGKMGKDDGTDIVFTSSDGTTKLSHEIEKYASTTGETVAWVKIPTLSAATDTTIFIYFGNAAASDQQDVSSVWDSNYLLVSHLGTTTPSTVSYADSTSNANNGTASGSPVSIGGQIDGAMSVPGAAGTGADYGSAASIDNISIITIEAWIKRTSLPASGFQTITNKGGSAAGTWWAMQIRPNNGGATQNRLCFRAAWSTATGQWDSTTQITDTSAFYHVAVTYNKGSTANNPAEYINGIAESVTRTTGPTGTTPNDSAGNFTSAYFAGDNLGFFTGTIDEIRYSNIARSVDWIKTSYDNQLSPSTFFSYGAAGVENRAPSTAGVKARGGDSSANPSIKIRGGVKFK